ncbi:hypothetical protein LCGC14_0908730 [marine sediment metagenome]|uniref:Uncharacterized protein n=1 Tax=marine sediment metagenome TaxID=412755 RepID=A0A0F9S125_9ZZZZ
MRENQVYYEARVTEELSKTRKDKKETPTDHKDLIEKCRTKHGGKKKGKAKVQANEEDTGIVAIAQDQETDYEHRFDGTDKGEVTIVGFEQPMNRGPLYLESDDGFQSKFLAWTVRKDGTDDGKVLIHVNDKMYIVPISLEEVKGLLVKMEEFYEDLPNEFDTMVQAFIQEYAEDNGTELSNSDIVSRGLKEALDEWTSHDFIVARDRRVASNSRMRLMALPTTSSDDDTVSKGADEGTRSTTVSGFVSDLDDAKFGGKGATTKTVKCPECDAKVLAATGYCVVCKKKTIKAESVEEAGKDWSKVPNKELRKFAGSKRPTMGRTQKSYDKGFADGKADRKLADPLDRYYVLGYKAAKGSLGSEEELDEAKYYYSVAGTLSRDKLEKKLDVTVIGYATVLGGAIMARLIQTDKPIERAAAKAGLRIKKISAAKFFELADSEDTTTDLDEASVWQKDMDVAFDAVAEVGMKDPGISALGKVVSKTGTSANFKTFKAAVKKVKDAKARKALYVVVNGIEKGKYKAEFKLTFGGKPGDVRKVSQVSALFDQVRQAANYDESIEEGLLDEAKDAGLTLEKIRMSGEHQAFKVLMGKSLVGFLMQTGKTTADEEHPWKAFGVARGKVGEKIGFYYKKDGGKAAALKAISKGIGESLDEAAPLDAREKKMLAAVKKAKAGITGADVVKATGISQAEVSAGLLLLQIRKLVKRTKEKKAKGAVGTSMLSTYVAESLDGKTTTLFQVVAEEEIPEIEGTWRSTAADGSTILMLDESMEDMTLDQALSFITRGALKAKQDLTSLHIEPIHLTHAAGDGDAVDDEDTTLTERDWWVVTPDSVHAKGVLPKIKPHATNVYQPPHGKTVHFEPKDASALKKIRAIAKAGDYRIVQEDLGEGDKEDARRMIADTKDLLQKEAKQYGKKSTVYKALEKGARKIASTHGLDYDRIKPKRREVREDELLDEVYTYTQGDYIYSAHKIMPTAPLHQGKFIIVRKSGKSIAAEREVWTGKAWVKGKQAELEDKGKKYEKKAAASADIKKVAESAEYRIVVCNDCSDTSLVSAEAATKCPECASEDIRVREVPLDEARAGAMTMKVAGRKITEPTHLRALAKKAGKSIKKAMEYWGRAQERAEEQYPEIKAGKEAGGKKASRYYSIVTAIFKNMLGLGKKAKPGESIEEEVGPVTAQFECPKCGQEFARLIEIGETADGCIACDCDYATLIDSTEVPALLILIQAEEPVE